MIEQHLNEQWAKIGKFYKTFHECFGDPLLALTQLNAKTLSNLASENNKVFETLLEAKKPEEFMSVYTEIANKNSREITRYSQELFNVISDSSTAMLKMYNTLLYETARTGETLKAAADATKSKAK